MSRKQMLLPCNRDEWSRESFFPHLKVCSWFMWQFSSPVSSVLCPRLVFSSGVFQHLSISCSLDPMWIFTNFQFFLTSWKIREKIGFAFSELVFGSVEQDILLIFVLKFLSLTDPDTVFPHIVSAETILFWISKL